MEKAVIFDLDGTLLDTLTDIYDSVTATLDKFNAPRRTVAEIRQFIGNGAKNLIKTSFGGNLTEEQLKERLDFYNQLYTGSGSPKTCLFDGVKETLIELKSRGYKLGILTNKPQLTTDDVYKTYLSEFDFSMVVGQRAGAKVKPDPTELLKMLDTLSVSGKDAYFVGDGETDVEVAKNANVKGIAVLWGYRDKEQLSKVGAVNFVSSPEDLLKIIN